MNRFFITGTDTNIGKTFVSTILANGLGARYWKPIQTGTTESSDKDYVGRWIGRERVIDEAYTFAEPLSPHLAASHEKREIHIEPIYSRFQNLSGPLVVEGAGGVMVPINERHLMLDLIALLKLPTLVVSSTRLGTINHTLLTLAALKLKNIPIAGVITNGAECRETTASIKRYGSVRIIGHVSHFEEIGKDKLERTFKTFDLETIK